MANFLDDNFDTPGTTTSLDELVQGSAVPTNSPPDGAVRNRAATTALLSEDPSKAVQNYQLMMQENANSGGNSQVNLIQDQIKSQTQRSDIQGVMSVLGNASIPLDMKQAALDGIKSTQFLKDTSTTLLTNSLTKPSAGENREQEDARISTADAVREIYQAKNQIQGLVNAHGASLQNEKPLQTLDELGELWVMPFGNNVNTGNVNAGLPKELGKKQSAWDMIKGYVLAGSTTADLRAKLESVPPAQRPAFAKSLLNTIKNNSGILFSNDNQFAQYDKALAIFDEGGYSTTQEWLDNVSPLLDIIGIGQAFRSGGKASKIAKAGAKAAHTEPDFGTGAKAGRNVNEGQGVEDVPFRDRTKPPETKQLGYEPPLAQPIPGTAGTGSRVEGSFQTELPNGQPRLGETRDVFQNGGEVGAWNGNGTRSPLQTELSNPQLKIGRNPEAADVGDQVRRIEMRGPVTPENPSSPAKTIQQANPETARSVHASVYEAPTEELATAMYGTGKVDAMASDILPQVTTEVGAITTRVADIDKDLRATLGVTDTIYNNIYNSGAIYYSAAEKAGVKANIVNDFRAAEGLVINDPMSSFTVDGGRIKIGAVFGSGTEGGFVRAEDGIAQAKLALRNYGVLDDEIEILAKQGLDHVPVKLEDVKGVDGNYYIRVNTFHEIDPTDIANMEKWDVKRNIFDRNGHLVSENKGSLTRYIFDAASTLHPQLTGSASVVADATSKFEKNMAELAGNFSGQFASLPKDRQNAVSSYIREANYNQIAFDQADLIARGFNTDEISTLRDWRKFWDNHYYLENLDVVRTLNSQGYQKFKNNTTELYAKPISKNSNLGGIYDPSLDAVVYHTKAEGDIFYAAGGTYAKLRRPASFGGEVVEHMMVRNTPTEYLRKFRDSDRVLNYRDGYFQIQYKAARFVDQVERDANGAITGRKTLAVAADTPEAEAFATRMATSTGQAREDFVVRGDDRGLRRDSDSYWDVNSASGRIAQRYRGKLLEDASGLNHLGDGSYILDPVESAVRAARSISGRTVSRPMMESAKARFLSQYKDMLPSNGMGGVRWPSSVGEIHLKGQDTSKAVADARTTYEYINYLENGYINSMDEVFKTGLNALANIFGSKGFGALERGSLALSEKSITGLAKNGVFTAYIASNFVRQWIVQPHQVMRTFAYNPIGWANGGIQHIFGGYAASKAGLTVDAKSAAFVRFVDDSGMLDSVDKSNLVRGVLVDAADSSNKTIQKLGEAASIPRKIGFDIGESANLLGHAAAVYEKRLRAGQDLTDKAVRDAAYSEIRALSYDMNFAGDLPYNQTSAAMVMQFLQVPHKAFLQATNRRIPASTRATMIGADIVMWGTPAALIASTFGVDLLPDNPKLRDFFLHGLESMALNNMFHVFFDNEGEKTDVDFSAVAPYDLNGWVKLFKAGWDKGLSGMLANSPAGQLFAKDGGRVQQAWNYVQRFGRGFYDVDEDAPTFLSVVNEVAKISSFWSNAVKAKIALETRKRYDQFGSAIDSDVTPVESVMMGLGFPTGSMRDYYDHAQAFSSDIKKHKEDVIKMTDDITRYYAEQLQSDQADVQFITKVTGAIFKAFENDPEAMRIAQQRLKQNMSDKDNELIKLFMKRAGILGTGGLRDAVKTMPVDQATKDLMNQYIDDVEAAKKEFTPEGKK